MMNLWKMEILQSVQLNPYLHKIKKRHIQEIESFSIRVFLEIMITGKKMDGI